MALTQDQLLQMPESNYMNQDQLTFFKNMLLMQYKEIENTIKITKEHLLATEKNTDTGDMASSQEMQEFNLRTVERLGKLLKKISQSLEEIENGTYGFCHESGEPIGLKRLLARPTATVSIEVKEAQEHSEKIQGKNAKKRY